MANVQTNSGGDDARRLVREADALIVAREAELAELRAQRARISEAFQVQQREDAEARARKLQERHAAAVSALASAESERLGAIERIDTTAHVLAEAINQAVAALGEERAACLTLASLAGRERLSLHGMDHSEQLRRIAARLVAILAQNVKGASHGLGRELGWSGVSWTLEAKDGWPERERRLIAPDIVRATEGWQR